MRSVKHLITVLLVVLLSLTITEAVANCGEPEQPLPTFIYDYPGVEVPLKGTIPDDFILLDSTRLWSMGPLWIPSSEGWRILSEDGNKMWGSTLRSTDKQCELFINRALQPMPRPEYWLDNYPFYHWSQHQRNLIMYDLMTINDGRTDMSFEEHVAIEGGRKPKKNFNADSVFCFNVPIEELVRDGMAYKHATKVYIFRKERPVVSLVYFFTDEGKKREKHYMDKLNKHIWFTDDEWEDTFGKPLQ